MIQWQAIALNLYCIVLLYCSNKCCDGEQTALSLVIALSLPFPSLYNGQLCEVYLRNLIV